MAQIGLTAGTLAKGALGRRREQATGSGPSGSVSWLSAPQAASIISEWRDLATRGVEANVFFHPGILLPAIDHLDQSVAVATLRDRGGRLIGLAPMERRRLGRIAPALRIWSHDYAPLGAPLLDAEAIDHAAAAAVGAAAKQTSLIIPCLPVEGEAAAALCRAAERAGRPWSLVDEYQRAILDRPGGPATIRAALPHRRRKEFARQMRRLADLGSVSIETAVDPDRVRARFEEFLTLEAAGWKGAKATALASLAATAAFARDIVFNRSERGTIRIVSLRLGDHPVAIVVCFIAGSTAFTWKIAYDEHFARFSPGAQLMLETADALFGDPAIARIDSCASANHPMIDHLWTGRLALGTLIVGPVGGGALYQAGLASFRGEIEARAAAKHLRAVLHGRHGKKEARQATPEIA